MAIYQKAIKTLSQGDMSGILDFLFPRRCLGCGKIGNYFCPDCLNLVSLKDERICPMCGKGSFGGLVHPGCARPFGLDGLTSVFSYQGVIEKAIKKLKYRFVSDLASDLVELVLSFCGEDKAFSDFCRSPGVVLVPIPLHPQRLRWRGFNQAELLGRLIAENLKINFSPDLLLRVKNTKPQVELKKEERRQNIKGAFRVNSKRSHFSLLTSPFLIFDDVWTSGATLREATKVLKRNRASKVWGLTIAR
ncbi:MAG: double zinc ribbon domain-containing protein [Microgenomates group bacterium]